MRKIASALVAAVLIGGSALLGFVSPASATECVPSPGVAAYDEVIVDQEAYDEEVIVTPAVEARWVNYNWNGGPIEGEPEWPGEGWHANDGSHEGHPQPVDGEPGFTYDRSHGSSGNADWFHWDFEPGSDAVIEIVHHEAVTHTVHHEAIPPVTCEEEPVEVTPLACAPIGDWYTEGDDAEPVLTDEGLVFTGGSGDAVGLRAPVTGNLQGWAPVTYTATGDTEVFYFRIVIDSTADGGHGYSSLTVTSGSPVTLDSVAYSNKLDTSKTIAEWAEFYPNAVITSVGFHLDSAATADQEVLLTAASGPCASANWVTEPPVEEPPVEEPPAVVPPVVNPPAPAATTVTPTALADTGFDNGPIAIMLGAGTLLAGSVLLTAALANRRKANK